MRFQGVEYPSSTLYHWAVFIDVRIDAQGLGKCDS
jgi:hypothetical protein